ncbi:MAG: dihydroorotate dehydrogenase-like protein [Acidobacteriota bacterium]
MDLTTTYLGLTLPHPLMPGASPLAHDLDAVRRLEDAGAAAIVMHSLFEEQITRDQLGMMHHMLLHDDSSAEALSYFPAADDFAFGPDKYLEQVRAIKKSVKVPVIASLNGTTSEGWLSYAHQIQQAGADALELNFYHVATNTLESGADVEARLLETVRTIKTHITIPIAVKLSPFYSSVAHLALELEAAGADGLVLFNRFYQPDIDPEMLESVPRLQLSTPDELLLRLRWLAILSGRTRVSLAATGGVHTGIDALKAVMAGAHAVQMTSALLHHGPGRLAIALRELTQWLIDHEYHSLRQAQGSMSLEKSPNPEAFERGNYMRILQTWHPKTSVR